MISTVFGVERFAVVEDMLCVETIVVFVVRDLQDTRLQGDGICLFSGVYVEARKNMPSIIPDTIKIAPRVTSFLGFFLGAEATLKISPLFP